MAISLKPLLYPLSLCSSAPKSEGVIWFIFKTEIALESRVLGFKSFSSHHSGLALEQNATGEFGVMKIGVGEGRREVIFHAYSGSDDVGNHSLCLLCIEKGRLKPKRRRNWLDIVIKGISPGLAPTLRSPAFKSGFFSIKKSEI